MSTKVLGPAWDVPLPSSHKLVLISLADQANDAGVCWPSVGSISRRTGLSDRTVQSAVRALSEAKLVEIERKNGRTSHYRIDLDRMAQLALINEPPKIPHPRKFRTPENVAPTPENVAPKPSLNRKGTVKEPAGGKPPGRDWVFETLAEVCGLDWKNLTSLERGRLNVAAKALRPVCADEDEIRRRAGAYRKRWPGIDLTPTALASNWGQCVAHVAEVRTPSRDERDTLLEEIRFNENWLRTRGAPVPSRGALTDQQYHKKINDLVTEMIKYDAGRSVANA